MSSRIPKDYCYTELSGVVDEKRRSKGAANVNMVYSDSESDNHTKPDAVLQVRNSNPAEKKSRYYQLKCRHALYMCTGILFLHITMVTFLGTGNENVLDRTIITRHISRSRDKRDAESSSQTNLGNAPCNSGHVSGLSNICDLEGCLDQLTAPKDIPSITLQQLESFAHNLSLQFHMHDRHDNSEYNKYTINDGTYQTLLSVLTFMQWSQNIYGSVGGLGIKKALHMLFLASHTNTKAGEHFLVSDPFRKSHEKSLLENVLVNLKSEGDNNYHMHIGEVNDVGKGLLKGWNLPQFRFISVDGASHPVALFSILEKALCFLRDGGIISVEGLDSHEDDVFPALEQFFNKHGTDVLHPLLVTNDRVFLCTSSWINFYTSLLRDTYDVGLTFRGREVTTSISGQPFSYLFLQR